MLIKGLQQSFSMGFNNRRNEVTKGYFGLVDIEVASSYISL